MTDWFEQNSPQKKTGDWFAQHAPPKGASPIPESPQEPPGFWASLSRGLIGATPSEALQNIGETAKMAVNEPGRLASGLGEFAKQAATGIAKMTPAGALLNEGFQPPSLEEQTAIVGGPQIAESARQAGRGEYAGAAGTLFAGALQALTAVLGVKAGAKATPAAQSERLASGAKFPLSPAVVEPTSGMAKTEAVVSSMPGGGPIRKIHAVQTQAAKDIMDGIFKSAADEAGATIGTASNPGMTAKAASRAIEEVTQPIYREVSEAMKAPEAAAPATENLSSFAKEELKNVQVQSVLGQNPTLSAVVQKTLRTMAGLASEDVDFSALANKLRTKAGGGKGSFTEETLREMAEKRPKAFQSLLEVSGVEPPKPPPFEAFQELRSGLLAYQRAGRISRAQNRILNGVVQRLTDSMEEALGATNPDLMPKFQQANRQWSQARALDSLGDKIIRNIKGTTADVQAEAGSPVSVQPQKIQGQALVETLEKAARDRSLARAIPKATDAKTLRQVADRLSRLQQSGEMGAKLGVWRIVGELGAATLGVFTGHPGAGLMAAAAPEVGAYIIAKAMALNGGANLVNRFLKAGARTAAEGAIAKQLAMRVGQSEGEDWKDVFAVVGNAAKGLPPPPPPGVPFSDVVPIPPPPR